MQPIAIRSHHFLETSILTRDETNPKGMAYNTGTIRYFRLGEIFNARFVVFGTSIYDWSFGQFCVRPIQYETTSREKGSLGPEDPRL